MNTQQLLELLGQHLPKADAETLQAGTLKTEHRSMTPDEVAHLLSGDSVSGWLTTAKGNWFRRPRTDWTAVNDGAEPDLMAAIRSGNLLQGELVLSPSRSLRLEEDAGTLLGWFLDDNAGGDAVIWQSVTRLATIPANAGNSPALHYAVAWQMLPRAHGGVALQTLHPVAARLVAWKEN